MTTMSLQTRKLPRKMTHVQAITVAFNNETAVFIFGSYDNNNIYKYNTKLKSYELYDKYKIKSILNYIV